MFIYMKVKFYDIKPQVETGHMLFIVKVSGSFTLLIYLCQESVLPMIGADFYKGWKITC